MRPLYYLIILFCLFFVCKNLYAQDPHFSLSYLSPLQINPALSGSDDVWDVRVGGQWKSQWASVPVAYRTFSAFYDQKLPQLRLGPGQLAAGAIVLYDQAGDGQLSWAKLGARVAYHLPLSDEHRISLGAGFDFGQRRFFPAQLRFGDQYNGELFDPDQLTGEAFDQTSSGLTSVNIGFLHRLLVDGGYMRTGFSAAHLNAPVLRFYESSTLVVPMIFRLHNFSYINLPVEEWKVTVRAHVLYQGTYLEGLVGLGMRYEFPTDATPLTLGAGLAARFGDAFIPHLEAQYGPWNVAVSYDINTSPFRVATNRRGGLELAVHYYMLQTRPPEDFKSCPIF